MKKAGLLTSASTAVALTFGQSADAAEVIDNIAYARNVANHLTQNCNNGINVNCLSETLNLTYSIAANFSTHIKENSAPSASLNAGITQGELYAFCEVGVQKVTGQNYPTLGSYKAAVIGASTDCIESLQRAQSAADVLFQPTAVNTLANHINCLEGKECITTTYPPPRL